MGGILELASQQAIPTYEVSDLKHSSATALLAGIDLIVVACFPFILPKGWLDAPRLGCLNLHPSMLPAYRGPQPLFWQLRAGEQNTGITLHFMEQTADTGDIAAQAHVRLPDGISESEVDTLLANKGAALLVELLRDPENIPRSPQDEKIATYQPAPAPEDYVLSTSWNVRKAYNFIQGVRERGGVVIKSKEGVRYQVSGAQEFAEGQWADEDGWIGFADGSVKITK
jgi:methionyl-tRNA formyltransferase